MSSNVDFDMRQAVTLFDGPLMLVQQRDGPDQVRYLTWSRRVRVRSLRKVTAWRRG